MKVIYGTVVTTFFSEYQVPEIREIIREAVRQGSLIRAENEGLIPLDEGEDWSECMFRYEQDGVDEDGEPTYVQVQCQAKDATHVKILHEIVCLKPAVG